MRELWCFACAAQSAKKYIWQHQQQAFAKAFVLSYLWGNKCFSLFFQQSSHVKLNSPEKSEQMLIIIVQQQQKEIAVTCWNRDSTQTNSVAIYNYNNS